MLIRGHGLQPTVSDQREINPRQKGNKFEGFEYKFEDWKIWKFEYKFEGFEDWNTNLKNWKIGFEDFEEVIINKLEYSI